jgi:hypothetical protein
LPGSLLAASLNLSQTVPQQPDDATALAYEPAVLDTLCPEPERVCRNGAVRHAADATLYDSVMGTQFDPPAIAAPLATAELVAACSAPMPRRPFELNSCLRAPLPVEG